MSSRDPRFWMWAEACQVIERAERLQRQFFRLAAEAADRPVWEPPTDVFETAHELWILAALPGVPAAEIRISLEGGILHISGTRALPAVLRHAALRRLEIPHGRFERRIELPAGLYELRRQELQHGCLILNLHKLY